MRRRLKKWWWLCAAVGAAILVIAWQEGRCQAQANQCRTYYTAQDSHLLGKGVDSSAAEQQAINAACQPNGYFCRLFSAASLPTWLLVFVGIGGIWAAVGSLRTIQKQTEYTETAASAALLNAQAVMNAERAWVVVSVESPEPNKFNFRATNVGKTPAKIRSIWSRPIHLWRDSELEVPPDEETGESLLSTPPSLLPPTDSQIVLRCDIGELGPGQYVGPDASARVQNDIQKGFRMLYFYGRIIYSDTLDEKSVHETRWLYWYVPVGEGAQAIPDPRHPELNSYS